MLQVETKLSGNTVELRIAHVEREGDTPQYLTFDDDEQLRDDLAGSLCATVLSDSHEILLRHAARPGVVKTKLLKQLTKDASVTASAYQVALDQQIAKYAARLAQSKAA